MCRISETSEYPAIGVMQGLENESWAARPCARLYHVYGGWPIWVSGWLTLAPKKKESCPLHDCDVTNHHARCHTRRHWSLGDSPH